MRRKRRNHSPGFKAKVAPWRQSEKTKRLLSSPGSMTCIPTRLPSGRNSCWRVPRVSTKAPGIKRVLNRFIPRNCMPRSES